MLFLTRLSFQVTLSVLTTAGGVIVAALGDFSFDLFGYSMAFISVFFQVCHSVLIIQEIVSGVPLVKC